MRRFDSGWRDGRLNLLHAALDVPAPLHGMSLPMVEYDRGEALAVINYSRRDVPLTKGPDVGRAFAAVGRLRRDDGCSMPFLTAQYDPRNWAMRLFPHNRTAADLLGTDNWLPVTEQHFVRLLYRLRGRQLPDLASWGVDLSTAPWLRFDGQQKGTSWPGQDMSVRRRNYEPAPKQGAPGAVHQLAFRLRNPCTDIDLAVVSSRTLDVALLVDYKLNGANIDVRHKTHQAMAGIRRDDGQTVPSMIVQYDPSGDRWKFSAHCLNDAAADLLTGVMLSTNAVAPAWRPDGWVHLDEQRWYAVLDAAQTG